MGLSSSLLSQFAKATKPTKSTSTETTHYATVVEHDGRMYVRLDGSELLTPVATTTDINNGERVTVMIKNHQATVTGNISSPSARTDDLKAARAEIKEGKFIAQAEVFLEPGLPEYEYIRDNLILSGRETFTEEELALYDFNGDGRISVTDALMARHACFHTDGFTLSTWSGAKKSMVTATIDVSNPSKLIRIQGTNMWGREIDVYMGSNSPLMDDDASETFRGMVEDYGESLFVSLVGGGSIRPNEYGMTYLTLYYGDSASTNDSLSLEADSDDRSRRLVDGNYGTVIDITDKDCQFNGTALKATQDANGNNISDTYVTQTDLAGLNAYGAANCIKLESGQICSGQMLVAYAATTASNGHYYGDATSISGGTFPAEFASPPIVTVSVAQGTTSVFGVEVVEVTTTGIANLRIHRANAYTDTTGLVINYTAVGAGVTE